ncbi:DUF599 domain-containing protein [Endozoicomonas sp. OPT23]|uniref:DUF599 domain-containing protein n=1 Tax=Endozoicomonas sp. OPT23 TaxID=2072845 RepID=UPI00129A148E|nr:DUF599 family protein [Endozoicomonas sp. OPT23]MRI34218.1 DUF599 domain-containing protein [Endozoicomonas sp. OPT23]
MNELTGVVSLFDWLALSNLIVLWLGYTTFSYHAGKSRPCLAGSLALYRRDWMYRLLGRDNRIADASLIFSLRASVSFFASTSILVMAGLITGIAASEEAVGVLSTMPFVSTNTRELWELKVLVMLVIFVYTFFEFTWSLRLYNFTCVLVGSAPLMQDISGKKSEQKAFADKSGHIMTLAANHFNYGLRGYYFSLATLAWFIHPGLFMFTTMAVVMVLYRREFHSSVLHALEQSEKHVN